MKFTAPTAAFAAAVTAVTRVVENRNTYPILANVLIKAEDGKVSLRATDLDIEISLGFDATVESVGTTTVPARMLDSILRKLDKASEVLIELVNESTVTLKSGRSRFTLSTLSPDSFPDLKVGTFPHNFDMAAADLRRMIDKTDFAISTEETRYYLNGIYLHAVNKNGALLRAVATDGHRMSRYEIDAPDGAANIQGVIIPRKTVAEIYRLIEKVSGDIHVELSDTKILVTVGGTRLLSKLIEGTFPDYDRVTPKNNNRIAVTSKKELRQALDRVSTLLSDRGGKAVKLTIKDGALTLEVNNADHGSATEEIAVQFDPDESFEIGFNAGYLGNVLDVIDTDNIRFELNDSGSPAILRGDGADSSFMVVLMPMRV